MSVLVRQDGDETIVDNVTLSRFVRSLRKVYKNRGGSGLPDDQSFWLGVVASALRFESIHALMATAKGVGRAKSVSKPSGAVVLFRKLDADDKPAFVSSDWWNREKDFAKGVAPRRSDSQADRGRIQLLQLLNDDNAAALVGASSSSSRGIVSPILQEQGGVLIDMNIATERDLDHIERSQARLVVFDQVDVRDGSARWALQFMARHPDRKCVMLVPLSSGPTELAPSLNGDPMVGYPAKLSLMRWNDASQSWHESSFVRRGP